MIQRWERSSIFDRQDRIRQLKVYAKRKEIVTCFNPSISVTTEDFISIEETINLTEEVYKRLDATPNQSKIEKEYQTSRDSLLALKEKTRMFFDKDVVLLHRLDRESGAVVMSLHCFWFNLDYLLDFIGFRDGYRDLVAVDKNLEFGICIERHEYYNNLALWYS